MSSSTDKSPGTPGVLPGYETRDVNVRGIFKFLVVLSVILLCIALLCLGLFRHFFKVQDNRAPASPFSEIRQLPTGPQLQVNPRQDLLRFRAEQKQSLESYSWENRDNGTVRVPIERAMELLLQKGFPVAPSAPAAGISENAEKPVPKESATR